jgi:hypothetical protein
MSEVIKSEYPEWLLDGFNSEKISYDKIEPEAKEYLELMGTWIEGKDYKGEEAAKRFVLRNYCFWGGGDKPLKNNNNNWIYEMFGYIRAKMVQEKGSESILGLDIWVGHWNLKAWIKMTIYNEMVRSYKEDFEGNEEVTEEMYNTFVNNHSYLTKN